MKRNFVKMREITEKVGKSTEMKMEGTKLSE